MNDTKPWWTSISIWGSIATLVGLLLPNFGINVNPTDLTQLANSWAQVLDTAVTFIGLALTIYGRIHASKQLTLTRK